MAVRPPSNDADEPDAIEFGIAALDARLEESDVEFPATQREVLEGLSSTAIPYDASGRTLDLGEAFDRVTRESFETRAELMNAVHPVFEERRRQGGSVFDRLREALPF
ncbi:hypothetical protein [Halopenitus persicus]|uniref:Uncharacterized protein n=1 Tax=Halopenitus persicus TaxID=1048396 RepID=A0A1H3HH80_9EURY|nr:hypothetical protein [Halopenitus persicus]QHS15973.1 hypothetical protein GWK26_01735 [haloarchaeon 3A1-DGR]SDY14827.1 hypothetical protein SAMN05216564_103279 [Halopenitus persicus]